jgi:hypothetical protein
VKWELLAASEILTFSKRKRIYSDIFAVAGHQKCSILYIIYTVTYLPVFTLGT